MNSHPQSMHSAVRCTAMVDVRRKLELSKTMIKRVITTHELKVLMKHRKEDLQVEGRRKPKQKESFMIHSNDESQWYDKDGTPY